MQKYDLVALLEVTLITSISHFNNGSYSTLYNNSNINLIFTEAITLCIYIYIFTSHTTIALKFVSFTIVVYDLEYIYIYIYIYIHKFIP